jgi:hypothetical protein
VYPVVLIGTQYWLVSNLNETKYRTGDWITGYNNGIYTPISNGDWAAKTTEAMCYYGDNETYGDSIPLSDLIHPPVTIDPASAALASITDEQVLSFTGASGSFTTADSKTVTVLNGIITAIT